MSEPVVLHATPSRLRVRLPIIWSKEFNPIRMESWLESQPGVQDVRINRKAGSVAISFDPKLTRRKAVLERLTNFRNDDEPATGKNGGTTEEIAAMLSSAASLALMPFLSPPQRRLLAISNAAPILLKGADTFINEGIRMEVLDALAVGLAGFKGETYSATITTFLLALGEYLEHQTERKSDHLLRRLLQPEPAPAWVQRDGELVQIPSNEVQVGETVVVGTGETVPVDGRVTEGVALLNQAAVTGEDLPVRKEKRHRVIAGSVVEEGRIHIEAQRVGDDTTTAKVASFIQSSLENRSATQRMANELADKRVWLTLGTGGLAYALTRDLRRLESVLLVDYSCALKLGTPVAFKSGMYRAATHGILMRGGNAIENLAEVDTFVFDKTGTLTHSELVVTDVVVLDDSHLNENALLALVASIEEHATHPLAQAVVEAAKERDLQHITHGEVEYLVAHGLATEVDSKRIIIGSRHFLEEHHAVHFAAHETELDRLQDEGKTLLYVGSTAQNGKAAHPVGVVALRDTLRADAVYALQHLRNLGIKQLVMITGDKHSKAEALAVELGLDAVHAEVAPEEKAAIIQQLQEQGCKVAFVGDGINDGPALTTADVGIAMPRGADIARATADIVLMDDRLAAVADARDIASRTMQLIRSNFNIAVGVNTAILAGAMLGRLSPVMSAILHNGTTIGVLLRALVGVDIEGLEDKRHIRKVARRA